MFLNTAKNQKRGEIVNKYNLPPPPPVFANCHYGGASILRGCPFLLCSWLWLCVPSDQTFILFQAEP